MSGASNKNRRAAFAYVLLAMLLAASAQAAGEGGNDSHLLKSFPLPSPSPVLRAMNAEDPFAESHARLMRAADAQIEKVRDARMPEAARPAPIPSAESPGDFEALSAIRPEAIAAARERLRALGVEADRIFAEEGVPQALLVVAQVESNFNPLALSPKGARGLWQLMPETAARFGLRVDTKKDDRTHPVLATRAAARYLRELYVRFGDWLLALAAYNAGEGRVESALAQAAADKPSASLRASFWHLATLGLLPEETRRYVPAILARL